MRHEGLSPRQRHAAHVIHVIGVIQHKEWIRLSQADLAMYMGISERHAKRQIRILVADGFLERHGRGGWQRENHYRLISQDTGVPQGVPQDVPQDVPTSGDTGVTAKVSTKNQRGEGENSPPDPAFCEKHGSVFRHDAPCWGCQSAREYRNGPEWAERLKSERREAAQRERDARVAAQRERSIDLRDDRASPTQILVEAGHDPDVVASMGTAERLAALAAIGESS
jgi:hypothetical protein